MKKVYEHIVILKADLTEDEKNKEINRLKNYLNNNNIEIDKIEDIGKKKLAYEIQNNKEGYYLDICFLSNNYEDIENLERYERLNKNTLKFLTVNTNEIKISKQDNMIPDENNINIKIDKLNESTLFKGIAKEFLEQIDYMKESGHTIDLNMKDIKKLTNNFLNDNYIWGEINNTMTDMILDLERKKEQENEEESEEDSL